MLFRVGLRIMRLLVKRQYMHVESVSYTRSLHQGLEMCLHLEGRRRRLQWTITGVYPTSAWDHLSKPLSYSGTVVLKELYQHGTQLTVYVQQMPFPPWSRT